MANMNPLDYQSPNRISSPPTSGWLILGTCLATTVHLAYCAVASHKFFAFAGGIRSSGIFTAYGGIDYAWTNLSWIPGGFLAWIGDGGPAKAPPLASLAMAVFLFGSLSAGFFASRAIAAALSRFRNCGRCYWRLWAFLPFWLLWLPVPVKMTLTYWYTVGY